MKGLFGFLLVTVSLFHSVWADAFEEGKGLYSTSYEEDIIAYEGAISASVDEEETAAITAEGVVSAIFTPGFGTQNQVMGVSNQFSSKVKTVFFNTELDGMVGKEVAHCWYHNGKMVSEEKFVIDNDRFYAISKKEMLPSNLGEWRVEVRQQDTLLEEKSFTYLAGI